MASKSYFSFQWHITDRCDQRCKHCYIYAQDPGRACTETDWDHMMLVLDKCLEFCRIYDHDPIFFITGGDPLLHPQFLRLLRLLHRKGIPFVIMCNPFHLTTAMCLRLKYLGCLRCQVSIDGLEETHDMMRKPGSYKATMKALRRMKRVGLSSVVMTTVSSINIKEMPRIIEAVAAAGADAFSFARYCPSDGQKTNGISPEEYRQMLADCGEKIRELIAGGCETFFEKKDHLWTLLDYEEGRFVLPEETEHEDVVIRDGCHCGISHLTILPGGDVYACRRVPDSKVGNVFTDQLADIWVGPMQKYRDYSSMQRCADCRLQPWCRGCPAVAKSTSGEFGSADPQCWRVVE